MGRFRWDAFWSAVVGVLVGVFLALSWVVERPAPVVWPVVSIARKVDPSVVAVVNLQRQNGRLQQRGLGTGVILDARGDIVTNYHVVAGASSLMVILSNGRKYPARIVGIDPPTDLAVVHIQAQHLKPLGLANSSTIEPGELVVAIGNSLGLSHTVTSGIISARDRVLYRDGWEYHLIQTDAAINPGNSGGPLVNANGLLIGINSSKIAQAGVEGIGFAIPSNTVRYVVTQILQYGHVRRPWIGLVLGAGNNRQEGLLVVQVIPGSPAARAGVRAGDLLISVNGHRLAGLREMVHVLEGTAVGSPLQLGILRGMKKMSVTVTLGERHTTQAAV